MSTQDDILKRIVKCYLTYEKEASAGMIARHIDRVGYGIRKMPDPVGLAKKIKIWEQKSPSWFNVRHYRNSQNRLVFYLKE